MWILCLVEMTSGASPSSMGIELVRMSRQRTSTKRALSSKRAPLRGGLDCRLLPDCRLTWEIFPLCSRVAAIIRCLLLRGTSTVAEPVSKWS